MLSSQNSTKRSSLSGQTQQDTSSQEPAAERLHRPLRADDHRAAPKASPVLRSRIEKKRSPPSKPAKKSTTVSRRSSSSAAAATTATIYTTAATSSSPPPSLLIRVFVNNRLGTRVSILCSPSDSVTDFKKMVAFHLGTRPDAIMLKRQSERPRRGELTLADYEIGNGSSLDLEVDAGGD